MEIFTLSYEMRFLQALNHQIPLFNDGMPDQAYIDYLHERDIFSLLKLTILVSVSCHWSSVNLKLQYTHISKTNVV